MRQRWVQLSELKEQLFELQENCEDLEFEKHKWESEKKELQERFYEMEKENKELKKKAQEGEQTNERLKEEMQDWILSGSGSSSQGPGPAADDDNRSYRSDKTAKLESIEREYMFLQSKLQTRDATNKKLIEEVQALKEMLKKVDEENDADDISEKVAAKEKRKKLLSEETTTLKKENKKLENDNLQLNQEVEWLRKKLNQDAVAAKLQNSQTQSKLVDFERENSLLFSKVSNMEKKHGSLLRENSNLKEMMAKAGSSSSDGDNYQKKNDSSVDLSSKIGELEKANTSLESRLSSLHEEKISLQKDIFDMRKQLNGKHNKAQILEKENNDLSFKIKHISDENNRAKEETATLKLKVAALEEKLETITSSTSNETSELSTEISDLQSQNDNLRSTLETVQNENKSLRQELAALKVTIDDNGKNSVDKEEQLLNEIKKLKQVNDDLASKVKSRKDDIEKLEHEIYSLEETTSEQTNKLASLQEEKDSLNDKYSASQKEIEKLEEEVFELEQKLESGTSKKSTLTSLESDLQETQSVLEKTNGINAQLKDEIESITSRLNEKEKEGTDTSTQLKTLESENKDLSCKLRNLEELNDSLHDEIYELEEKLTETEAKMATAAASENTGNDRELMERVGELEAEKNKIQSEATTQKEENDMLKEHVSHLEVQLEALSEDSELKKELNELQSKIVTMEDENKLLRQRIQDIKEEACSTCSTEEKRQNELIAKVQHLEEENASFKKEIESLESEKEQFDEKVNALCKTLDCEINNTYDTLVARIEDQRDENGTLQSKLQSLATENEALQAEMEERKQNDTNPPVEERGSTNTIIQSWQELDRTKKTLIETEKRLRESQSQYNALEKESKRMGKEHVLMQATLRNEIAKFQAEKEQMEKKMEYKRNALNSDKEETKLPLGEENYDAMTLQEKGSFLEENLSQLESELDDYAKDKGADSPSSSSNDKNEEIKALSEKCADLEQACQTHEAAMHTTETLLDEQIERNDELTTEISILKEQLKAQEDNLMDSSNNLQSEFEDIQLELEEVQSELESLRDELDFTIQSKRSMEAELRDQIRRLKNEKEEALKRQEENLENKSKVSLQELNDRFDLELAQQQIRLSKEIEERQMELDGLRSSFEDAIQKKEQLIQTLQQDLEEQLRAKDEVINTKRETISLLEQGTGEHGMKLQKLNDIIEQQKISIESLKKESSQLDSDLRREIEETKKEICDKDMTIDVLKSTLREKDEAVIKLEQLIDEQKQKNEFVDEELAQAKILSQTEIKEMNDIIDVKNVLIKSLESQVSEKHGAIQDLNCEVDKMREEARYFNKTITELQNVSQEEWNMKLSRVNEAHEEDIYQMTRDIQDLKAQLDESKSLKDDLDGDLQASKDKIATLEKEMETMRDLKTQLAEARFAVETLVIEKKILTKSQNGEVGVLRTELDDAKAKWSENEEKLREALSKATKLEGQLQESQNALKTCEAAKDRVVQESCRAVNNLRDEIKDSRKKIAAKDGALRDQTALLTDLKKQFQDTQVSINNLRMEKESSADLQRSRLLNSSRQEIDSYKSQLDAKTKDINEKIDIISSLEKDNGLLREKLTEKEKQLSEIEKIAIAREQKATQMGVDLDLLQLKSKEVLEKSKDEINKLKKDSVGDASRIAELEEMVLSLRSTLKRREVMLEDLQQSSNKNAKHQQKRAILDAKDDELRKEMVQMEVKNQLATFENSAKSTAEELTAKLHDRNATISALVKASVVLEKKLSTLQKENDMLRSKLEEAKSSGSSNDVSLREKDEMIQSLRKMLGEIQSREADLIQEMARLKDSDEYGNNNNNNTCKDRSQKMDPKEMGELKEIFDEFKTRESELLTEIESQKDKIKELESDLERSNLANRSKRLKDQVREYRAKIFEKDTKLKSIIARSNAQERQIVSLKTEIEELKQKHSRLTGSFSLEEMQRVQKESEIFAEQIIEQDEEISRLNILLEEKDQSHSVVAKELKEVKQSITNKDLKAVTDLKTRVEELVSANESQRAEIRELKQKITLADIEVETSKRLGNDLEEAQSIIETLKKRLSQSKYDEIVEVDLRQKLQSANGMKDSLEEKVRSLEKKLSVSSEEKDELTRRVDKLLGREAAILENLERTKKSASIQEETAALLEQEIKELRKSNEKKSAWSMARESKKLEQASAEIDSLKNINNSLMKELGHLKEKIESLSAEAEKVHELESQLKENDTDRAIFEEKAVSNFERKLSLLKMEKDITIDSLMKELTDAKKENSDMEAALNSQQSSFEQSKKALEMEFEGKLQRKNTKILTLEQKLSSQDQVVGNMRQEMDQLQSSMEKATMIRRAEIEEMQQEVMDGSARATKQEREITKLKMALEERKMRHKGEVAKLYSRINALEKDSPLVRGIQAERDDRKFEELNDAITKLQWRNTSLSENNKKLQEKVERHEMENKSSSKNDKWRNSALSEQVKILTRRIKELESSAAPPIIPTAHSTSRVRRSGGGSGGGSNYRDQQRVAVRTSKSQQATGETSPRDVYDHPGVKEQHQPTIISRDDISTTTKFTF